MKAIFNYFFRGMLIIFPVGATVYLIAITINWINATFNHLLFGWIETDIPGLGILTAFILITLAGYVLSWAITRPAVHIIEHLFTRMPLVSIIYSSLKDLLEAFVGEQRKFNQPVKIKFSKELIRFGFVTQESLKNLGLNEEVAVYCPHSYNFSGNLYIVPVNNVTPVDADPADFMKFIVSGGVTGLNKSKKR